MTSSAGEVPTICPDPSVHPETVANQDSANKAAQLAAGSRDFDALGPDGKLSAAGAATSLRYAKPQDLPSFPSVGIDTVHSGNKAANLANANPINVTPWRPDASSSAGKAAILAARDGGKLDLWQYKADGTGNTAATMAMGKKMSPSLDLGYTEEGHKRALQAATRSLSTRETSPPTVSASAPLYPDQQNAGYNALNAASVANRPGSRGSTDYRFSDPAMEASRIKNLQGVSRDMYGENPQSALALEEKRHKDALHASAVSMAKKLYELEKDDINRLSSNPGSLAAERVGAQSFHSATTSTAGDAVKLQAMNYVKVQEAAQKLAAERLAKLDPDGVLAYKEHYGYGPQTNKSRFSFIRTRGSTAESTGDPDDSDDEAQAAKIKSQMSRFNEQVAAVDSNKRSQDRESLMAAAERAVHARMSAMDQKVFEETGKMSPAMTEEWEAKAKAKAAADSEARMVNHGKIHIGGGQYMDQSEIDQIAAKRMQPTLDEINEEAERRRVHEALVAADLQRHREEEEAEKQRQREVKAELKRIQDEEKERIRQERAAEKAKQKAEQDEEKRKQNIEKMQRDLERRMAKQEAKQERELDKQNREGAIRAGTIPVPASFAVDQSRNVAGVEESKDVSGVEESKDLAASDEPQEQETLVIESSGPFSKDWGKTTEAAEPPTITTVPAEDAPVAAVSSFNEPGFSNKDVGTPGTPFKEEISPILETKPEPTPVEAPAATRTSTVETPATTTTSPSRRDSRLKGFLGKLTGKRSSKVEPGSTAAPTVTAAGAAEPELSEKAKGKQRASLDSVSSMSDSENAPKVSSGDAGNDGDVFEEAQDHFSDAGAARVSTGEQPSISGSKFQEHV